MSKPFNHDDYAYVVGIDFGTTYSGCCYAFTKDTFDDFQDITAWPKQRNAAYPKTPTVIMYKKDSQEVKSWGDAARIQSERPNLEDHLLEKFKLHLDEAMSTASLCQLPNGLTPLQVIADYLRSLHEYICLTMKRGFAQNYAPHQYRYCLTVPATWSDQAKAVMREASIMAGLIDRQDPSERLTLISEPEAAALYCQKTCDQFKLVHGQRFMICDAGGGTVDLIVFEINDIGSERSLKEVTKGSGDSVGSVFLDQNMEQLIRDRFRQFGQVNQRAMDQMMTTFVERIKPQFDDDDEDHFIPIPFSMGYPNNNDEEAGIIDGTLIFSAEELKEKVFEPVVLRVLQLISNQLDGSALKPVDAIFMVGGFGKSNYLHRRVNETFVPRVQFVGIPPRAEMAVVRGAVYFGLNPRLVAQRVSRRTYGLNSQMPFDARLDPPSNCINVNSKRYCRERFSVYANKGQPVGLDECVTKKYLVVYPHGTETDLYAFDDDGVPPRLVSDPRIKLVARFPIKMPTFEGVRNGQQLTMTVNMFFGQTEIKIEVLIRDRRCVFTSRLDLLTADSFNNIHQTLPSSSAQQPPPYASPTMSSNSSQGSWPTSSSTPSTPKLNSGMKGKPDEYQVLGKPDDSITSLMMNDKPHESEPSSPTTTTTPPQRQANNDNKHQMMTQPSSSPLTMVLTSTPPSTSADKTLPPPPPTQALAPAPAPAPTPVSSTKELLSSVPINVTDNSNNEEKTLNEQQDQIIAPAAVAAQQDEKTLEEPMPAQPNVSSSPSSTRLAPPSVAVRSNKKKSFTNKLLVKLKLA
ncbi:hypothetical protein BCR42DRAFT_494628 [Absidia repens]|uniref:Actin-like ATPase domain-containing protein n=1 Tax=Absidia repens TaxID=90262 RepID=A0A1X2I602_9FUNG|nr:hypothetical protein BCR42DRAFT_494628 [Absidia repens]